MASTLVPDGSTQTSVSHIEGSAQVELAPVDDDRASYNRFSRFDIDTAGARFNNIQPTLRAGSEENARSVANYWMLSHCNGK